MEYGHYIMQMQNMWLVTEKDKVKENQADEYNGKFKRGAITLKKPVKPVKNNVTSICLCLLL